MNKNHDDVTILNICNDIKDWGRKLEDIPYTHVIRRCNEAAHLLTTNGLPYFFLVVFILLFGLQTPCMMILLVQCNIIY